MFIDLFGCIIMFVCFSVFPALLVFLANPRVVENVDKRQIRKYSTMFKGYELSARKTENKPLGALMTFRGSFNLYFNYYYDYDYYFDYYFIIFSLGGFSETGCHVVTSKSNSEETVCSCNHLTNFAVLLDYNGIPGVMN